MKIAEFSESYKPYISGVTRSVEIAKKGLEELGHEVFLFAPGYPGFEDTEKNIFRLPSIPSKYPGFRIAVPYPGFIPDFGYDIVHSNSPFGLGYFSMKYAKKNGLPFVYTFHTLFSEYLYLVPVPKKISAGLLNKFIIKFCNDCSAIIVPNKKTSEYLAGLGVNSRMEIIPSGTDILLSQKASDIVARKDLGVAEDKKLLIYVGRLSKEKNVPFLLKMLLHVLKKRKDVVLALIAGGPLEVDLKKLAGTLGIEKNVVFAGPKNYPDVLNYYKCGDVFVFSSKTETQGLVIAEAKSCGLPVVAVNAGGICESIVDEEDGFLVEEDASLFADKILFLLNNDTARKEMSIKALANASRDFSLENVAKKMETLYNSLLNRRGSVK